MSKLCFQVQVDSIIFFDLDDICTHLFWYQVQFVLKLILNHSGRLLGSSLSILPESQQQWEIFFATFQP